MYQINNSIVKENMDKFNAFINKHEGHIIHSNGDPNDNGYYNSFFINGPGEFDENIGKFIVEENLMNTLSEFNQFLIDNDFFQSSSDTYENGSVLNMSLQNSISMTVEMYKPDSLMMVQDKI